ncbi:exocyst complex component EXO70E2-like [Olea europaea var. sylvestris]|uniref:exocyst complex component EXO70E2-like n=1 Tax=Olea europaea var. sylvestris TaxID=158386 RepID=UPI000C1D79AB|nr:exocyst complex component EXO70E2-like [Olea europaea var. sylvestris]
MGDAEEHVIAAAYHVVKALEATKNLNFSNDVRRLLADLDAHLSTMTTVGENEVEKTRDIENRLRSSQEKITGLHSNHLRIWNSSPAIVSEYLQAVDEVRRLIETLESYPSKKTWKQRDLLDRAQCTLQIAMTRLQDELVHILAQSKQHFEQEYMFYPTCEENSVYEESVVSNGGDSVQEDMSQRESSSTETEEYVMDLVHPDVIPKIASIANIMFASHYDHEFCQAFVRFWRDELAKHMMILNVEQFSVEDVLKMEWKCLNSRIRKWRRAIKNVVGIYLASEKRLFDQVLGEYGTISSTSLVEASKVSLLCLLNFGHAVAIGPHRPERLYCLLDMYEVLASLISDVESLFPEEAGRSIRIEFHDLLRRLGDSAKAIFMEFGNHIASRASRTPFANGGIHPLTKYVVNYILCLVEYGDTLNLLLAEKDGVNLDMGSNENIGQTTISCPVAVHLQSVTSILEANLDINSNLYINTSLKYIFVMNNIHYMYDKIKSSEVRRYFGDEWIREHIAKYRRHAMSYERFTWNSILSLIRIRDDGKTGKATLKERCRDFSIAFEDVYKIQTAWYVPNLKLREELRISISQRVIPAYRNFVGNITNSIGEKYLKYTVHDLESYILDLLDNSQKSLKHPG